MAEKALSLSPLDPLKYYFDSLAASAYEADGQYARAVCFASRAIRSNRKFFSSHLALFFSEAMLGNTEKANQCARVAMQIRPNFTVTQYRNASPHFQNERGSQYAKLLENFGFPI
jgi:tetratricopeptide (TPR) repeat protein